MASNMGELDVLKIYKDITSYNLDYCGMCLRTSLERRIIVDSDNYKKLLKSLSVFENFKNTSVCFICEARIRVVLQTLLMVNFASGVGLLFSQLEQDYIMMCRLIEKHDWHTDPRLQAVLEAQTQLSAIRRTTALLITETLTIDDSKMKEEEEKGSSKKKKPLKRRHNKQTREQTRDVETVVLDDEESDVGAQVELADSTVPSEVQQSRPRLIDKDADIPTITSPDIREDLSSRLISNFIPFCDNPVKDNDCIVIENPVSNSHSETDSLTNSSFNATSANEKDNGFVILHSSSQSTRHLFNNGKKTKNDKSTVNSEVMCEPSPKTSVQKNVDWEDKIPIDLISLVDSHESCLVAVPPEAPLAVISQVTGAEGIILIDD